MIVSIGLLIPFAQKHHGIANEQVAGTDRNEPILRDGKARIAK